MYVSTISTHVRFTFIHFLNAYLKAINHLKLLKENTTEVLCQDASGALQSLFTMTTHLILPLLLPQQPLFLLPPLCINYSFDYAQEVRFNLRTNYIKIHISL